jgi:hypothetical protein
MKRTACKAMRRAASAADLTRRRTYACCNTALCADRTHLDHSPASPRRGEHRIASVLSLQNGRYNGISGHASEFPANACRPCRPAQQASAAARDWPSDLSAHGERSSTACSASRRAERKALHPSRTSAPSVSIAKIRAGPNDGSEKSPPWYRCQADTRFCRSSPRIATKFQNFLLRLRHPGLIPLVARVLLTWQQDLGGGFLFIRN